MRTTSEAQTPVACEFLSFRLGNEEYAIDIHRVQEIRRYEAPTRVADAPPCIQGVFNLRGVIVPMLDLRVKLACASADCNNLTVVIVLNVGGRVIGAVVDSVTDVLSLGPEHIRPAPEMSDALLAQHIIGMGCVKSGDVERMLILLDVGALVGSVGLGLADGVPSQAGGSNSAV